MSPARIMAKRKRSEHYVNNKEFLAALIRYREDIEIAEIRGNTSVHGKFCIHAPSSKYPVCIDSRLITDLNYTYVSI